MQAEKYFYPAGLFFCCKYHSIHHFRNLRLLGYPYLSHIPGYFSVVIIVLEM